VRAKYQAGDEVGYTAIEKKFFNWVDSANDGDIGEFCRKHVQIKGSKAPSLKTLLGVRPLYAGGATRQVAGRPV
jgi:hypothetical protein